ncbi:haptoglobin [Calypte anna]|uniref:haptoglobin n=1 Tax=Calypte anna TaxID=9244 RepID=UPI0011C3D849|nr:haptoglobin [Calypte anna]
MAVTLALDTLQPSVLLITGLAWIVLETAAASEWNCAKPVEIQHGHVEHLVRYWCDPHYQLHGPGDGTYKRDQDQEWVNPEAGKEMPVCKPVCRKPKNPPRQLQRIIGGLLSRKGSFPWQGQLVTHHNLTTGATLISDQWLLTTGRNVYLNYSENAKPEEIAPTLQLYLGSPKSSALGIESVVLHPEYPRDVDLALLKVKQRVPLGEKVMPICLPQKNYVQPRRVGYVSGWGRGATFAFSSVLKFAMLPVAESEKCRQSYEAPNASHWVQPILSNYTFCVGMSELREDTCYGDAGGAFAVHDPDASTWYAAGILSYYKTCAASKYGVYVDLRRVLEWVKDTVAAG